VFFSYDILNNKVQNIVTSELKNQLNVWKNSLSNIAGNLIKFDDNQLSVLV